MLNRYSYLLVTAFTLSFFASCTQKPTPVSQNPAPSTSSAKAALMAPLRYHKLIESSPGQYYDVYSWGRGKDSSGAYMILHSDSLGKQYTTINGDLEGSIIDVYNTDMNMNGYPEVLIEAKAKDTTNHVNIYAYEFVGGKGQKISFPKLTDKTKKMYRGNDNFYIKDGNLIREFPTYDGKVATGQKKIIQYGLRDGAFTIKDISPIDNATLSKASIKDSVKKKTVIIDKPKKSEKPSPKKKHHHEEEHHKKKKKHHHREE